MDLRRAADRFVTDEDGVRSWHSFSFGAHFDPDNTGFGALVALNEVVAQPGHGFALHTHRELEIVTWVVAGALRHEDSAGHTGVVRPGVLQHTTAGTGIEHAESNAGDEPLRFVQMWLLPAEPGRAPAYAQHDADLVVDDATLHVERLGAGATIQLPSAPRVHLFVTRGSLSCDGPGSLGRGDALRLVNEAAAGLTAADDDTEVLVWAMA